MNPWPPRSPDMTSLDFLWGVLKERVYSRSIHSWEHLGNRIFEECADITPETLDRVRRSFLRRIDACERSRGRQFEHLLD
ncbi:DDE 3 domain containing protein [Asbolus verrucosus]|uniref:DDE 3 domain containing protein n=1 Tax=Asbolus verrucosus TaxID=1661398 RepID=A0A482VB32_ASBVE|nr:DDE 3 domain containing protein [Asbolus verrucosus]